MRAPDPTRPVLAETVGWAAHRFGDRPAFVDPDGTALTYSALHEAQRRGGS
ncbi:MAG: hypothetical protein U0P45_00500 [Acidimicrobiales bacterium]